MSTPLTILIVEDNCDIRENTTELLELYGHKVMAAKNGKEGFDIALKETIDIVLCDILMPVLNGYELYTQLNNHPPTKGKTFIFFTARVDPLEEKKGMEMGAAYYLKKPFSAEELLEAIEKHRETILPGNHQ